MENCRKLELENGNHFLLLNLHQRSHFVWSVISKVTLTECHVCGRILLQNEGLNGGGTLFINKHPDLKVRVVHGNTLTAAVILNDIPRDVDEVFLTGATSKLGRAIALYLARRRIRVLVSHFIHVISFLNFGTPWNVDSIDKSRFS